MKGNRSFVKLARVREKFSLVFIRQLRVTLDKCLSVLPLLRGEFSADAAAVYALFVGIDSVCNGIPACRLFIPAERRRHGVWHGDPTVIHAHVCKEVFALCVRLESHLVHRVVVDGAEAIQIDEHRAIVEIAVVLEELLGGFNV